MAADPTQPPLIVGRYLLYGPLASGGMATVHLGRLIGPGGFSRMVAIKRLHEHFARDPDFVSGLLDEARLSARITHPNVVPTIDIFSADEHLLLVMEYVQGESLARLLEAASRKEERAPLRVAIGVMTGALHGLHAAHEAKNESGEPLSIVHRDVSPQNIMVGVDGVPRVLDFGVAKAVGRLQHTEAGQLKGKFAYMAPEQIRSKPVDRRTDIFAASVVLWELLTSKRLFVGDTQAATMEAVLHGEVSPPSRYAPGLPPDVDELVMRGMSRDPGARFATAREMALALEERVAPGTGSQIAEWVQGLAEAALLDRAKRVQEIESTPGLAASPDPETSASRSGPHRAVLATTEVRWRKGEATVVATPARATARPPASPGAGPRVADRVATRLAAYLGPHTSKVAVKTFTMKALGRGPETLTAADIPSLQAALRPLLRTFIGRAEAERVLDALGKEYGF